MFVIQVLSFSYMLDPNLEFSPVNRHQKGNLANRAWHSGLRSWHQGFVKQPIDILHCVNVLRVCVRSYQADKSSYSLGRSL